MSNCSRFDKCSFCGQFLSGPLDTSNKSGGRPRKTHDECGNAFRLLNWFSREFPKINFTPERAAVVRSDLVRMANTLPVARSANGRFQSKKGREGGV